MLMLAAAITAAQPALGQATAAPVEAPAAAVVHPVSPASDADLRGLLMRVDEQERVLKASPLVIRDPALNSYVRSVLCRTIGNANCAGVRLYILRTPDFNATMAPNGVMEVFSGLLLRTRNEAQLAAVLGHEYTHFEQEHSLKLYREAKSKSATAAWLAFTGIGLIASIGIVSSLFKYSRDMEQEADLGGVRKMAAAGYDTREAAGIWEQLRAEMDATAAARNTRSRKDKDGGIFASHPPSAERVAYLKDEAGRLPGRPGETGQASWRQSMQAWWPVFLDDQIKRNDFGATEYLLDSSAIDGWTPWLLYARGELYRERAGPGDCDKAISSYDEAIAKGGELPAIWRGRGLARIKAEHVDAGKADLAEYLRRSPEAEDHSLIAMISGATP
jgi:predicted Zn-dependent protease